MVEPTSRDDQHLPRAVGRRVERRLAARREAVRTIWFGFGLFGVIGWSIVLPTLGGTALGWWLDREWPGGRAWLLPCLAAGLSVGCATAWHWIAQEQREIDKHVERRRD